MRSLLPTLALSATVMLRATQSNALQQKTVQRGSVTMRGSLTQVASGDTVRISVRNTCRRQWCSQVGEQLTIKLSSVLAPTPPPPFAFDSISTLTRMVGGQLLMIAPDSLDADGSVTGNSYQGDRWINRDVIA
ncbi:hypothetical protein [Vreelandella sulfidaeris]